MKLSCDDVRDLAPDLVTGRLSAATAVVAREHIAGCAECAAELELVRTVSRLHLPAPKGLHDRVVERIVRQRPAARWGRMQLAVAATVALVLVGGRELVISWSTRDVADSPPAGAPRATEQTGPGWMTVEGALNSGAAGLGDLSEEQLRQLLTELES